MSNQQKKQLSQQIHLLGDILGETIKEQEGDTLFDLVEEIRALAKAHREGDEPAGSFRPACIRWAGNEDPIIYQRPLILTCRGRERCYF